MDSDAAKLFIGGISWDTTEEKLREHFSNYGEVAETVVMRDKLSGKPRGFGFVAFADPSVVDRVIRDSHSIDGRTVEAKRALSREEQQASSRYGNPVGGRTAGGGPGNFRTKKIFVGGLPPSLMEDGLRQYFQTYGNVTDVVVMYDSNTQRPRGFGFVSFDTEDAVDLVLHKSFHELSGKMVEVKRALPKDANPSSGGARSMGGATYQSYGGSGANPSPYDGRTDANRYMQPPAGGASYPSYGSYGAPGYGYGATNNGVPYGGYGVGGYGGATAGYGGPAGAYGNSGVPTGGYVSGPPGAPRSPWNNQTPSGYGSAGYGANTGYGATVTWNAPAGSGGTGTAPASQSSGGTAGYGSQGYGYGGYGGEGPYGNQGGYGAVGGRTGGPTGNASGGSGEQGAGPGYMGGGYGDAGGSTGYPNAWRSDPSQAGYAVSQTIGAGGSGTYGGGYGGQTRQGP